MVGTPTSDLNVILPELTSSPGVDRIAEIGASGEAMSSDRFRRELAELENICKDLPEPQKSTLAATISSLQAQFDPRLGVSPSLAVALQEARVQAVSYQQEVRNNDASDLAGALASLDQYHLSAADRVIVESRLQAIYSRDWEAFRHSYDERYESLPKELRAPVEEARALYAGSPEHTKRMDEITALPPEELARRIAEEQKRYADAGELVRQAPGEYGHRWRHWRDTGVTSDPGSAEAIRLAKSGDYEAADRAMRPVADAYFNRVGEIINSRSWAVVKRGRESFIRHLAPELRAQLEQNPELLGEYIRDAIEGTDPAAARRAYDLAGGNIEAMPEQYRQYWRAHQLTAMTKDEIRDEVLATDRSFLMGLNAQVERGGIDSLTNPTERRAYEEMTRMIDDTLPLAQQVRAVSSLAERVERAGGDSKEYMMGYAALNFAYARTHGGTIRHDQMMHREDAEGRQYQREFRAWQAQQLGRGFISEGNDLEFLNNRDAITALGREIVAGRIDPSVDASGNMLFLDTETYSTRSTFLTSRESLSEVSMDYGSMMRELYREAIRGTTPRSQDPQFVELVRNLDVYRMQTQSAGRDIIRELWVESGTRSPQELLQVVRPLIAEEREGLSEYGGLVLSGRDARTMTALERNSIIAGGQVDVACLMQVVDNNKTWTTSVYQRYNGWSYDELISRNEPIGTTGHTTRDLAEARMLSAVATEMRSAHSVEHIGESHALLLGRIESLRSQNQPIPENMTRELASLDAIMTYNPLTASTAQTLEFEEAMRSYMTRDAYVYEKEVADQYLPEESRLNLVAKATAMVTSQLISNPNYLRQHQEGHEAGATTPATTLPATPAAIVSLQLDARETEGSGIFDGMTKDAFERSIISALSGLSEESRQTLLGDRMVNNGKNYNEKTDFISYNEVENLLKSMRDAQGNSIRSAEQIADVNGNGFDVEDIRAVLAPNATPVVATPATGQGTGRS